MICLNRKIAKEKKGKKNKSLAGFTTIELLVAIFVLVVGITGVLNVFPFHEGFLH